MGYLSLLNGEEFFEPREKRGEQRRDTRSCSKEEDSLQADL